VWYAVVVIKPKILDAFSCEGGAGMGYYLAGFDVTGVDIDPQPRYPFKFIQSDAISFIKEHGHEFDAIHTSPPCQHHSNLNAYNHHEYPDLIDETRDALIACGKPWVIENVPRAPLRNPTILCGQAFGLLLYRERKFESSFIIPMISCGPHIELCTRNGYLPTPARPYMSIHGGKHSRAWQHKACEVMGVPWMAATNNIPLGIRKVCEAIPPAYTEYVGKYLINEVRTHQ
jgi:DNA (cytosine-5)-methyltransferase 1